MIIITRENLQHTERKGPRGTLLATCSLAVQYGPNSMHLFNGRAVVSSIYIHYVCIYISLSGILGLTSISKVVIVLWCCLPRGRYDG